ncbi:MAG TPA: O-methyltransferase [Pilimelia sp.]|nr:O-methyltransferase [Pilimelia sp.]
MAGKTLDLLDDLHPYLEAHTTAPDPLILELIEETRRRFGAASRMQISKQQATLLTMLARLVNARRAVEVGTFTGLSSISVARALPADGRLLCLDVSEEFTSMAREYWARAGVADRIELRLGPATRSLAELPTEPHLDLAFIDADKPNYGNYWAELVPRMRQGGLIIVDNVLWKGNVLRPEPADVDATALARFNDEVVRDERVDVVMLRFADGLTLARRR